MGIVFAQEDEELSSYELGNGLRVASLPIYVGGYFSLDYKHQNDTNRYRIDDIAFLSYGSLDKFSYMAEFEFKEFYAKIENDGEYTTQKDTSLHTERLYIDYTMNENYMVRVGKYNSQVGFWNLLPINVLRDTTSSPMMTEILFPKFTTGAYGSYNSYDESEIQVDVMAQYNKDLDPSYNNYEMDEHFGVGATYAKDDLSLKVNVGYFDNYLSGGGTQQLYYALASLKYEREDYQIMSEVGFQKSKNSSTTPYAGYLQGVYRLNEHHAAIARVESYESKTHNKEDSMLIAGYTYRPLYSVALKGEYQFHSLENEDQLLFSFSVLF